MVFSQSTIHNGPGDFTMLLTHKQVLHCTLCTIQGLQLNIDALSISQSAARAEPTA